MSETVPLSDVGFFAVFMASRSRSALQLTSLFILVISLQFLATSNRNKNVCRPKETFLTGQQIVLNLRETRSYYYPVNPLKFLAGGEVPDKEIVFYALLTGPPWNKGCYELTGLTVDFSPILFCPESLRLLRRLDAVCFIARTRVSWTLNMGFVVLTPLHRPVVSGEL